MKRIFLVILLLSTLSNAIYSQEKWQIRIAKDGLSWNVPQQIIDSKNDTVYVAFGAKNSIISLEPEVDDLNREQLNKLLTADKKIFVQQNTIHKSMKAGLLVDDNGKNINIAKVIIKKEDLPITLTFDKKKVAIIEFDPKSTLHCEIARECVGAYGALPAPKEEKVDIKDLIKFRVSVPKFDDSTVWKVEPIYYINNKKQCLSEKGQISIPKDLCSKIKQGDTISITYSIKFEHLYFGYTYTREGQLVEIYVTNSAPEFSWHWWYLLLLIPIVIVLYLKKKIPFVDKRKQRKLERYGLAYIEKIQKNKGSADKKNIIMSLLSNEDIEFRTEIVNLLDINHEPDISVINELKRQIEVQQKEIEILNQQIEYLNKVVTTLKQEKDTLTTQRDKLLAEKETLVHTNSNLEQRVTKLNLEINGLKNIIIDKDKQNEQLLQKNRALKEQLARINRQNMYLLQIDDVLKEVSEEIIDAFSEVEDGDLKKKLVLPLLNGVAGLDDGITTYYHRWKKQVMAVQHNFFGKDLYEMSDEEVKHKLVSGFLKNIAQGDTFSKLTRLYMYIQADWINEILIKNKFDVDKVEKIFNRLKILFNEFGIEIIYPRLFVDHMNESEYTFDPRCEVFKLFPISEEMRVRYSKQADLIIDIVQIGVRIPSEQYSRKAIVSIPNF